MEGLRRVYEDFCSFGSGQAGSRDMDSAKFVKLARDCGLLDRQLTTTNLDLIFTRVKGKGYKTIDFMLFQQACQHMASQKGVSFDDIAGAIIAAGGPTVSGTIADNVRFHDDTNTYTGVHQHGGPTHVDRHNVTMDYQLDRSGADVRGVKTYQYSPEGVPDAMGRDRQNVARPSSRQIQDRPAARQTAAVTLPPAAVAASRRSSAAAASGGVAAAASPARVEERLAEVFVDFASSVARAAADIDGARFFKLCKDCDLIDGRFTRTDCDLVFAKALSRAGIAATKRMPFEVFRRTAVPMIATHKDMHEMLVCQQIAATEGIEMSGTFAQPTRFHDDKNTYTGVHAAGGPTHVDHRITLSNLADRAGADNRGVKTSDYEGDRNLAAMRRPASRGNLAVTGAGANGRRRSSSGMPSLTAGDSRRGSAVNGAAGGDSRRPSLGAAAAAAAAAAGGPTFAGSANRKGGVYDRLSNPNTFTGVYGERFSGSAMGGRINGDTVTYNAGRHFSGSTNAGGDTIIRDISQIVTRR